MAGTFMVGETKVRPGTYFRVDKTGNSPVPGADDGKVAVLFRSNFGPLGKVVELTALDDYSEYYGTEGGTDAINEAFTGGAQTVLAVRVGNGGTEASISLKGSGTDAAEAVKLTTKYPTSKKFSVTVRDKASDPSKRECIVYSGQRVFETIEFDKDGDEATALAAAANKTKGFAATVTKAGGTLAGVTNQEMTGGADPSGASVEDYEAAMTLIEKKQFNVVCVDTDDNAVHLQLNTFLNRIFNIGQFGMAVVAEDPSKALDTRETQASSYNSEKMIYVLNALVTEGNKQIKGYQVAARIAGMVASVSSGKSLTHQVISGFTTLDEELTPSEIIEAEKKGCLVLALNSSNQVWIDSAINTLITPADNQDEGWEKIRRTKTRFELIRRCNILSDSLIGKVDNDTNGRKTVQSQLQSVIDTMISEGKLVSGTVSESATPLSDADYAYFDFAIVDKDSIEKLYLTYIFQYSTRV